MYDYGHINRLTRRRTTPFAFRDLYGLKQVYKHTFDEQSLCRKNFEVAASHQGRSQIFNFEVKFAYNSLKNLEDGYGTENIAICLRLRP